LNIKLNQQILIEDKKISKIAAKIDQDTHEVIDARNCIVTPGFIDSHTHPIFIGNRSNELIQRLEGLSYDEIKNRGGGILSSIKKVRESSFEELYKSSIKNISSFLDYGTTTIEAKSGYGLKLEDEIKSLKVIEKINNNLDIDIIPTFLGAHAVPSEYSDDEYVDILCNEMIPEVCKQKLAIFCDVFCEKGYFNLEQSKMILNKAKSLGLIPRIHADEFKYIGASKLASDIGSASADHLMEITNEGIKALASSDVVATLLPGTTFFLNKDKYANGRKLIDNNCSVSIASDFNPGTCTIQSLPYIMFLSMQHCGLTLEEAFLGVTYNAAKSLLINHKIGLIEEDYNADMILWDIDELREIPYWHSTITSKINKVFKNGNVIKD
tara:strand:+ start:2089 stop:3234 length:1146 start_codon:yes stop_codon:yes gene_type:complete